MWQKQGTRAGRPVLNNSACSAHRSLNHIAPSALCPKPFCPQQLPPTPTPPAYPNSPAYPNTTHSAHPIFPSSIVSFVVTDDRNNIFLYYCVRLHATFTSWAGICIARFWLGWWSRAVTSTMKSCPGSSLGPRAASLGTRAPRTPGVPHAESAVDEHCHSSWWSSVGSNQAGAISLMTLWDFKVICCTICIGCAHGCTLNSSW